MDELAQTAVVIAVAIDCTGAMRGRACSGASGRRSSSGAPRSAHCTPRARRSGAIPATSNASISRRARAAETARRAAVHVRRRALHRIAPCVSVRDARGRTWRVKWGDEVQVETLATRLAWAAGYFVETTYFVREGAIDGASEL